MVVVHYEDFSSIILANELILIWLFLFLNFASEIFASNLCGAGTVPVQHLPMIFMMRTS